MTRKSGVHFLGVRPVLSLTPEEVVEQQHETRLDLQATLKAKRILDDGKEDAYEQARETLLPESREWWDECLLEDEHSEDAEGLAEFIRDRLEPTCRELECEAHQHEAIKAQTIGDGIPTGNLEKLTRYETHLDRKLQRTLGMLIKLRELHG